MEQTKLSPCTNDARFQKITTLLSCFTLMQCLDVMTKNNVSIRHGLKFHTKGLMKELERFCEEGFNEVCGKDDETLNALLSSHENILKMIVRFAPNYLPVVENILNYFQEEPDTVLNALDITVTQKQ